MDCCIKGCDRPAKARGMCSAHYTRLFTGQDMNDPVRNVCRGSDLDRLKSKIKIDPQTGCWIWQASLSTNGYGQIKFGDRPVLAHRVSWILHHGEIPKDGSKYGTMNVLHKCDNQLCVNPDHLFLGDQSDNALDAVSKDRWGKRGLSGEKHGRALVTENDVREIRASDLPIKKIAEKFGLSSGAVQHIRSRRSWKHVI